MGRYGIEMNAQLETRIQMVAKQATNKCCGLSISCVRQITAKFISSLSAYAKERCVIPYIAQSLTGA